MRNVMFASMMVVLTGALSACSGPISSAPVVASQNLAPQRAIPIEQLRQMVLAAPDVSTRELILQEYVGLGGPPLRAYYRIAGTNLYKSNDGDVRLAPGGVADDDRAVSRNACQIWTGNAPPPCSPPGALGPFRRVYSNPGYNGEEVQSMLPKNNPGLPSGSTAITGYAYLEGWPGAGTSNSEFGLQFSPKYNWYLPYIHGSGPNAPFLAAESPFKNYAFPAGDPILLRISAGPALAISGFPPTALANGVPYPATCTIKQCIFGEAIDLSRECNPSVTLCSAGLAENATGWNLTDCCIFARVTSIAEENDPDFNDQSIFSMVWQSAELLTLTSGSPTGEKWSYAPWSGGGSQDWPNDPSKIIVTGKTATGEADKIDLLASPAIHREP